MGTQDEGGVYERMERKFDTMMAGACSPCPLASPALPPPWLDTEAAARGTQVTHSTLHL